MNSFRIVPAGGTFLQEFSKKPAALNRTDLLRLRHSGRSVMRNSLEMTDRNSPQQAGCVKSWSRRPVNTHAALFLTVVRSLVVSGRLAVVASWSCQRLKTTRMFHHMPKRETKQGLHLKGERFPFIQPRLALRTNFERLTTCDSLSFPSSSSSSPPHVPYRCSLGITTIFKPSQYVPCYLAPLNVLPLTSFS